MRAILLILVPFAAGFFLSYLYQTVNSVIGGDLVRDIGLSASEIGLLTSVYFLTFALFQLPLGLLLDRFGPRRVNATLLLIAATGAGLFAIGEDSATLIAGRALIGLGTCACLMAGFKAITQWYPERRWPVCNAVILTAGGLGAVAGTAPVDWALAITDWRGVFLALAALTVLVALILFTAVPDRQDGVSRSTLRDQLRETGLIYRSPAFRALAPLAIAATAANLAIQSLWAGPWLRDVAGLERDAVVSVLAILNVGIMLGLLMTGAVAAAARRFGMTLGQLLGGYTVLFCIVQGLIVAEAPVPPALLWFLFGFLSFGVIYCFPMIAGHFPLALAGRANTAINLVMFAGGFAAQFAIGVVIDRFDNPGPDRYAPEGYAAAFGALLALQVAAYLWFLFRYRRIGPNAGGRAIAEAN